MSTPYRVKVDILHFGTGEILVTREYRNAQVDGVVHWIAVEASSTAHLRIRPSRALVASVGGLEQLASQLRAHHYIQGFDGRGESHTVTVEDDHLHVRRTDRFDDRELEGYHYRLVDGQEMPIPRQEILEGQYARDRGLTHRAEEHHEESSQPVQLPITED